MFYTTDCKELEGVYIQGFNLEYLKLREKINDKECP